MLLISTALLVLLLIPTAIARAIQAFREKNRYDLWTMTLGALALTLALALAISRRIPPEIDLGVSRRSIQLLMNSAIIGGHFALLLFYYGFVAEIAARRVRVRFEIALVSLTCLTISTLVFLRSGTDTIFITAESLESPSVVIFALVFDTYLSYTLIVQLYWTARYIRRFSSRLARFAASMAALGIGSILLAELYRLFIVSGHLVSPRPSWAFTEPFGYHGPVAWIFTHAGSTVLIASLMLPVAARSIRNLAAVPGKYRRYRQLEKLWAEAVSARPSLRYDLLDAKSWTALLRPSRLDFALRSRELTCQDYLADSRSSLQAMTVGSANERAAETEK